MDFFQSLAVYLFYLTICSATKAHPIDLITSTNVTKSSTHKLVEENTEHTQRKVRDNPTEVKPTTEIKPLSVDPRAQVKVQLTTPKPKSMPIPINFLIDTKPRTIPTKIPLLFKTGNVKPAPAHFMRLNADPKRNNKIKPKVEINLNLNKPTPKIKVMPKDRIIPKSIFNIALKNRNEKQLPRKKFKSVDFYEDDTNYESLPPALKPSVTRKNKRLENKTDTSKESQPESVKTYEFETESDLNNDVVNIRNGTHLIRITKLPEHRIHEHKTAHEHSKKAHEHMFYEDPLPIALGGLVSPVKPVKEDSMAVLVNSNTVESATDVISSNVEPVLPLVTENPDDDSTGIITIRNHNYEEVEERSGAYPENNFNEDPKQPWATPSWQNTAQNPYNYYYQNLQAAYDQYLKFIAENNPIIYKKGNCYPRIDASDPNLVGDPDSVQTNPPPNESQVVQDVYFGQKPDFNIVDIRPENSLGRIWRTWKDTEIKISKPNALLNKALELGRNFNNLNDVNFGEYGKPPTLYGAPAIGLNGYYDNLNNPLTYPYSYPTYRYML